MDRVEIAGVLYRLIRERAQKSPRVVGVALIAPDTWGIRADFDDGRRDYRYANGGPLETVPGGFDSWPPSPDVTAGASEHVIIELPLRHASKS